MGGWVGGMGTLVEVVVVDMRIAVRLVRCMGRTKAEAVAAVAASKARTRIG